jgi:hypothetical protein
MEYKQMFDLEKCREVKTEGFESYLSDDGKSIIVVERVNTDVFFLIFNNFEKIDDNCYSIVGYESCTIKVKNGYTIKN